MSIRRLIVRTRARLSRKLSTLPCFNINRSIKELRDRVGSVKNTKKITSAMKLVAAAKVRDVP